MCRSCWPCDASSPTRRRTVSPLRRSPISPTSPKSMSRVRSICTLLLNLRPAERRIARAQSRVQSLGDRSGRSASFAGSHASRGALRRRPSRRFRRKSAFASSITGFVRGDTLGAIADKYGVSVAALRTSNKIRGSIIHPGQDLLITAAPRGMDAAVATRAETIEESAPVRRSASGKHVVRRGDTLWSIARTHGVSMDYLADSNGLRRNGTLSVGQVLSIPGTTRLGSRRQATRRGLDDLCRAHRRHAFAHREQLSRRLATCWAGTT